MADNINKFQEINEIESVISLFAEDTGEFDTVNSKVLSDVLYERTSS